MAVQERHCIAGLLAEAHGVVEAAVMAGWEVRRVRSSKRGKTVLIGLFWPGWGRVTVRLTDVPAEPRMVGDLLIHANTGRPWSVRQAVDALRAVADRHGILEAVAGQMDAAMPDAAEANQDEASPTGSTGDQLEGEPVKPEIPDATDLPAVPMPMGLDQLHRHKYGPLVPVGTPCGSWEESCEGVIVGGDDKTCLMRVNDPNKESGRQGTIEAVPWSDVYCRARGLVGGSTMGDDQAVKCAEEEASKPTKADYQRWADEKAEAERLRVAHGVLVPIGAPVCTCEESLTGVCVGGTRELCIIKDDEDGRQYSARWNDVYAIAKGPAFEPNA